MKILMMTFVLLVTVQFAYGQKLRLDTFDHETKQVIKETEWIKVNGEHRKHLKIKFKRIGDEVKLYCTINRPHNEGLTSESNHLEIMLLNNVKMEIPLVVLSDSVARLLMEQKISNMINGVVRPPELTDVPDAITSAALNNEQLALLTGNGIVQMDLHYEKGKDIIRIKEKYRHVLKAQVAMLR